MQTQIVIDGKSSMGSRSTTSPVALRKKRLILSAIAMLSDEQIKMMNRQELFDALRLAQSPWPKSVERNIDQMEVSELRRLLAITRDYFRENSSRRSIHKNGSPILN